MVWYVTLGEFLLGILIQMGQVLGAQFLNFSVLWSLLPVYTSWFAIQFITRNREHEDLANRFMNGFAILWVGFELGSYLIENFAFSIEILIKTIVVIALFVYAFFIMRLTLQGKDITRYIARIGEISAINIAALLFVQDLLIITSGVQLAQLIIGFVIIYLAMDFGFQKIVDYIYGRVKIPIAETKEEVVKEELPKPAEPRYERITKPATPPTRPVTPSRPVTPPTQQPARPIQQPPVRPTQPPTSTQPKKKPDEV